MADLPKLAIPVATVVQTEVPFREMNAAALYEVESGKLVPFVVMGEKTATPHTITVDNNSTNETALHDINKKTFKDFNIEEQGIEKKVDIKFTYTAPITTSWFSFTLADNVVSPSAISITAENGVESKVLVNNQRIAGENTTFPETTAQTFIVTLYYSQPLRITEMYFEESEAAKASRYTLRFLARPQYSYRMYLDHDGYVPYKQLPEAGNLTFADEIQDVSFSDIQSNPLYTPADQDYDSIPDSIDNCPLVANTNQEDKNNNRIGDSCEDFDQDGLFNAQDNCQEVPNRLQQDEDGDRIGDHCDGVESRFIEQMSFLPWLGIAAGFGIVIFLFKTTLSKSPDEVHDERDKQNLTH